MTARVLTRPRSNARATPAGAVLVLQPPQHAGLGPLLLAPGLYHIGSDPDSDFVLAAEGIAPQHIQLVVEQHCIGLKALDSRTWVNDFLVTETVLRRGDRISAGPLTLTLRLATPDDLLSQLPDAIEPEPVVEVAPPQPQTVSNLDAALAQVEAGSTAVEAAALSTPRGLREETSTVEMMDAVPDAMVAAPSTRQPEKAPPTPTGDHLAEQIAEWQRERDEQKQELTELRTQLAALAAGLEEREARLHAFELRLTKREDVLDQRHAEFDAQRAALDARETALTEERLRLETVAADARAELTAEAEKQYAAWVEWETSQRQLAAQLNRQFEEIQQAEARCATAKAELEVEQQAWESTRQTWTAERAEWDARREEQQLELAQWESEAQQLRDELTRQTSQVERQRADLHAEACQRAAAHRELFEARQETQRERRLLTERQAAWMAERESQETALRERRRRHDADEREIADLHCAAAELQRAAEEMRDHLEQDRIALAAAQAAVVANVPDVPAPCGALADVATTPEDTLGTTSAENSTDCEFSASVHNDQRASLDESNAIASVPSSNDDTILNADAAAISDGVSDGPDEVAIDRVAEPFSDLSTAELMHDPTTIAEIETPADLPGFDEVTAALTSEFAADRADAGGNFPELTSHSPSSWAEAWNSSAECPVASELIVNETDHLESGFTEPVWPVDALSFAAEAEFPGQIAEVGQTVSDRAPEALLTNLMMERVSEGDATEEDLHAKLAKMFGLPDDFGQLGHSAADEISPAPFIETVSQVEPAPEATASEPAAEVSAAETSEADAAEEDDWRSRLAMMLAVPKMEGPGDSVGPATNAFVSVPATSSPHAVPPAPPPAATAEEDSIAAYMERLLNRNKLSSGTTDHAPAPKPIELPPEPARLTAAPGIDDHLHQDQVEDEESAVLRGSAPQFDLRPRVDKDEVRASLQSFRQVANLSARSALAKHSSKTVRGELVVQGVLSGLATIAAAGYWCGPLWGVPAQPLQGTGCLIAAGWMGWQISQSFYRLKNWNPDDHLINKDVDGPTEDELEEAGEAATATDDSREINSVSDPSPEIETTTATESESLEQPTSPKPMSGMVWPSGDL